MSFIILCTGGSWQLVNGDEVYVRNNVKNYGLNLPPNIETVRVCHGAWR